MPIPVTMPRLSDTMQQGTIVKWNVKEGQKVKTGDTIADIETDKATMELQSFDDGVVASINVAQGQTVPVGTVMMVLAGAGEDVAAVKKQSAQGSAAGSAAAQAPKPSSAAQGAAKPNASNGSVATVPPPAAVETKTNGMGLRRAEDRMFVSPLARKIAEESGVDLTRIQGSGPGGRIVRKDVEDALAGVASQAAPTAKTPAPSRPQPAPLRPPGKPLTARTVPFSNMRRVIAQRLSESKSTIPHYQVTVEVDVLPLMDVRSQVNEFLAAEGVKLSVNDFLVRACALAIHQHPSINSRLANDAVAYLPDVNIGVAIALPVQEDGTGGGLVVATLRNADRMSVREISTQTKALAEKARAKGLSHQEMSDATFTISNLGMFGVAHFNAIINPPNVAILAVGAAVEKPVVKNGQIVPGLVMSMTMSSDHRVVDGAMAAQYLAAVKTLLEKPASLLV